MNLFRKIFFLFLLIISVLAFAGWALSVTDKYKNWFTEKYKIKTPFIPNYVEFAGEKIPLENDEIKERLDRELMSTVFWQSNTMILLKRSTKFFPIIEQILKENNIPADFKYLCVAESGLANVTSPSQAKGFWQLMEGTCKPYNIEINDYVDERYNLEIATQTACKILKESYSKLLNWTLAAASYNRGINGILRDLSYQGVSSFYDLHLNDETARYIFRIVAYKLIFENPEMYGYFINPEDYYCLPPRKLIYLDTSVSNLSLYALQNGTNYKTLKLLNPWLRDKSLPNKKNKKYQIELPYEFK
ncbi:MAG: lytic transglycosylase domain-containing protein [Bacteroidetes bacterium]|nr:lytic transglycosylase domain-containing protein [Bacteroidota bacterium]